MPFTLAHPAAVLPLARRNLVLSALVIGSMSPDFEYFLKLSTRTHFGHTPLGLVAFSLPAGLAVLWIFHAILKWPLLSLLPASHQQKLLLVAAGFTFGPTRQFCLIVFSLLLGAITHVVWDSFTHLDGWAVQHFAWLSAVIWKTRLGEVQLCRVLQHGSTVAGLGILAVGYQRWWRSATPAAAQLPPQLKLKSRLRLLFYIGFGAFLLACGYAYLSRLTTFNYTALQVFYSRVIVASISGMFWGFVIFSLWWKYFPGRDWRQPLPAGN